MDAQELFYIVGSVVGVLFTLFACIAMFYIIVVLRRVHRMMDKIEDAVDVLRTGAQDMFKKADVIKNTMDIATQGIKTLIAVYSQRITRPRR